jgi:hypothetical protein
MFSRKRDRGSARRGLAIGLVAIPLVLACTATTPASPGVPDASPAPATSSAQTEAPRPSSTIDPTAASRISSRLEVLHDLYAKGDGSGIATWAEEEAAWVATHLAALERPAVAVTAYVANVAALRSAVDAGRRRDDAVVALLALRDAMAARASESP